MKNAIIIYKSRKGTTKNFSTNIANFLRNIGLNVAVKSIDNTDPSELNRYEYIFLGCWTKGLFLILQHPEKEWIQFAEKLDTLDSNKTVLFTTYKIRTGTMFKKMIKHLKFQEPDGNIHTIKSRCAELFEPERQILSNFILHSGEMT